LIDHYFSFVQLRGSVPLSWADSTSKTVNVKTIQPGKGKALISGDLDLQVHFNLLEIRQESIDSLSLSFFFKVQVLENHLSILKHNYETAHIVDVLSQKNGEVELHSLYQELLTKKSFNDIL